MDTNVPSSRRFPVAAGLLFGLGLGGFFDGIVFHQLLQWHHLVSHRRPPTDLAALQFNTLWDGVFHASTYIFVVLGLILLWRTAHRWHLWWSGQMLGGTILIGWGLFNLVEGGVSHHLLELHHVNETVPPDQWVYWDTGFLIWGGLMVVVGLILLFLGRRASPGAGESPRSRT